MDTTYKLLLQNSYMRIYFSKNYDQFAIVDNIEDSEHIYTLEEFQLFKQALNLI